MQLARLHHASLVLHLVVQIMSVSDAMPSPAMLASSAVTTKGFLLDSNHLELCRCINSYHC